VIDLTPKQKEAMDALASEQYRFILYGGAIGGGKTIWGLSALLIMCQIFPKSRWCVVRENSEKIRTTTIPSFRKLNPSGKLRENPFEYTHPNGSTILFKGENYDQDKEGFWLRGLEVNGFLFEEINECMEQTLDLAFSRAGRWECTPRPKPVILATANPSNNWLKSRVYDHWRAGTLPEKWMYIPAKVTDNPHLTEDYLEQLKYLPRYKYMSLVEGDWDVQLKVGGEFYKCFELDKHVGKVKYNPDLPLHVSWDDNVNPYLPAGIFQIEGMEFKMIKEFAGVNPNNTIKAVCREIIREYGNVHRGGMFIYGDATANKEDTKIEKGMNFYRIIMQELKQFRPQSRVLTHNPSVMQRGDFINTILEKNIYNIKIVIDESCKHTINDFIGTKEAADGTKLKELTADPVTRARYQKFGHFTDLTDYCIVSAFGKEYDKFLRGGEYVAPLVGRSAIKKNSY
jgi:hypothetical protein